MKTLRQYLEEAKKISTFPGNPYSDNDNNNRPLPTKRKNLLSTKRVVDVDELKRNPSPLSVKTRPHKETRNHSDPMHVSDDQLNHMHRWAKDNLQKGPGRTITSMDMYDDYLDHAMDNGFESPMHHQGFNRAFSKFGHPKIKISGRVRHQGIGLKDE